MNCPRCAVEMETKRLGEIEIEECPQCQGIWFDNGELDQAKNLADSDLGWWEFDIWKHQEQFKLVSQPLQCPRCKVAMFGLNYADTGVEIDACNQCHGVWLDGGEGEKILDALHKELSAAPVSDYIKASLQEGKEIFTGDKSLKAEWKDFTTVLRLMQYRIFIDKPKLLQGLIDGQKGAPIW